MEIIPAIIPKSAEDLSKKLELVRGLVETVHIDFCELPSAKGILQKSSGRFAQSDILKMPFASGAFRNYPLLLEAHLMVADPLAPIPDAVKVGFSRALVQVETLSTKAFAETIHEWQGVIEIGAVLQIETPLEAVVSFAHELKTLQLMGIAHIGTQGKPFDERVIARVAQLRHAYPSHIISVDGGVTLHNASALRDAGAERLVVGSAIWGSKNPAEEIKKFREWNTSPKER